ncbi:MAG: polymer-forming cytoskeletal protein [Candidatus Berkelbacteria bacterium]
MENNVDTIIGINVTIKGNLYNKGSIQVNGSVEGEVKSDENLIIGETAQIKGPVIARVIEISGEVKGLVEATDKLEIHPTGRIYGDINAKSLIIKEGATFVGKSIMPGEAKAAAEVAKPREEVKHEVKSEEDEKDSIEQIADKMGFFSKK